MPEPDTDQTELAATACSRCREQKLKCSRTLPQCARCNRLGHGCGYPPPPNRKALAAFRTPQKRRKIEEPAPATNHEEQDVHQSSKDAAATSLSMSSADIDDLHLPLPVQRLLQEIFFSYIWNASFIFHRPTFERAYDAGQLPWHNLLAVYASAAILLGPNSSLYRQHARLLRPLGDLDILSQQWAVTASREALKEIDQPKISTIRTCRMLELFWFSRGNSRRNVMLNEITCSAAHALGIDTPHPDIADLTEEGQLPDFDPGEALRRLHWAIYITRNVNADVSNPLQGDSEAIDIPLPSSELAYFEGKRESQPTLASMLGEETATNESATSKDISVVGLFICFLTIWGQIRKLIENCKRQPGTNFVHDLFSLDAKLLRLVRQMPVNFKHSKRNMYEQFVVYKEYAYLTMHLCYHQSRLVLYSSLVPLFSGLEPDRSTSPELTSMSAKISLQSAQAISEVAADFLALDWDAAHLPAFPGYCMYVSASIQLVLLSSEEEHLVSQARTNLVANLKLLRSLKDHWSNLSRLWQRLGVLYSLQRTAPGALIAGAQAEGTPGSIEALASQRRDTGLIPEPLADSVLQYTLRKLKADVVSPVPNGQMDSLSQLVDQDFASVANSLRAAEAQTSITPNQPVPEYTDLNAIPNFPDVGFAQPDFTFDRWLFDMDMQTLQQPAVWGDNLFNTGWNP